MCERVKFGKRASLEICAHTRVSVGLGDAVCKVLPPLPMNSSKMLRADVLLCACVDVMHAGMVFLQSDVLDAVAAMRDEFEQHAGDVLQLSPLHTTAPVFHWSREQEYAAAAAAVAAAAAANSLQQQEDGQEAAADSTGGSPDAESSSQNTACSSSVDAGPAKEVDAEEGSDGSDVDADFVSTWVEGGWLVDNPLGVPTERENYVLSQGGKVFRVLLVKKA